MNICGIMYYNLKASHKVKNKFNIYSFLVENFISSMTRLKKAINRIATSKLKIFNMWVVTHVEFVKVCG